MIKNLSLARWMSGKEEAVMLSPYPTDIIFIMSNEEIVIALLIGKFKMP
ncbi:MAG: hypothetical protein ABRQ37_05135 [Candidatus Eremiobacterota bacterium]